MISVALLGLAAAIVGSCVMGCSAASPSIQSGGDSLNDQSVQLMRDVSASLAEFNKQNSAGGDIIGNDPWILGIVLLFALSLTYVFSKLIWVMFKGMFGRVGSVLKLAKKTNTDEKS